jgi:hypothetical protein
MRGVSTLPVLAVLAALAGAQEPAAAPAAPAFMRFVDLGGWRGRLEVAIARYAGAGRGVTVDLVSAVHVGDAAYYEDLERRFAGYDAVLYELVAPEGTVPTEGRERGFNPVSALQQALRRMLKLEFQLEAIDYGRANFVHADLSPRDMARLWRERGSSLWAEVLQMMVRSARVQTERYDAAAEAEAAGSDAAEPPKPRGRAEKQRAIKWTLARELGPMEEMLAMFGEDQGKGSVILGERNKRAVEVLKREIAAGKKKIAIFYGAAHMPDMAARLEKDLGLSRTGEEWVPAWRVGEPEDEPAAGARTGR